MAEPTLYLFDGSNLFHAGAFVSREELVDRLASFVAVRGAKGVVVFDGGGSEHQVGRLTVQYAAHADDVLERMAAANREIETILLVTSDSAVRGTSGQAVQKRGSPGFLADLERIGHTERSSSRIGDRLDEATRERLERLRRGQ